MSLAVPPPFADLTRSWELSLRAENYSRNTLRSYQQAVGNFAGWLAEHHPGLGPADVERDHIRGWLAWLRGTRSTSSARAWYAGVKHFFRFLVTEEEITRDPTDGVRTPPAGEPVTPVLSTEDLARLLAGCAGKGFRQRRDMAILRLFIDGGLRLSELAGLTVDDIDLTARVVYVLGKGSRRSGPRHRAVPIGVRTAQALDRYLRERRNHPYAHLPQLWLGDRNRGAVSRYGIEAIVDRRAVAVGLPDVHAHMFRHTWASQFRRAGGSDGNLMTLGGWRSRTMLDRYGRADAEDRAREEYQRLSLGDRL